MCTLCGRPPAETTHGACLTALDGHLQRIPVLYAALHTVLEPGSSAGARVSGTRTPPAPLRVEPLSLLCRGGIVSILGTWETDWRQRRGLSTNPARADREQLLAGDQVLADIVRFLRAHLAWATAEHPAVDEFAGEVRQITAACRAALGMITDARRIGQCPAVLDNGRTCGRVLYADPYSDEIWCDRCGNHWPRNRWLMLGAAIAQGDAA